ncbi:MAG: sialidase family protein [Planctomycetota bacterium]|nr:sialidase family protein [Planctomycetota bacterium]MDP7252409.1 sialidase family protein [Planctomycetota bacterium]
MNCTLSLLHLCGMAMLAAEGPNDLSSIRANGANFRIMKLKSGSLAYGNRKYVWRDVPERFDGWYYTQTNGGKMANISFTADKDGLAYAVTSMKHRHIISKEWSELPNLQFWYTDGGKTKMAIFHRWCKAGEFVRIPQGNWTGGILLAPKLTMGKSTEVHYPPPGVIISQSPDPQKVYIGSPSIVILPDGRYVASHDWFGKGTTYGTTEVFISSNRGALWERMSTIKGQFWSTLFLHKKKLYIIGAGKRYGPTVIRRSDDSGRTWTEPKDAKSGLLRGENAYHCAPVPVMNHNGRIWRAMEDKHGNEGWGRHFRAFVMSASEDTDLLDASNWTFSNRLPFKREWGDTSAAGWLEGNIVIDPDGKILNVLRLESKQGEQAAVVHVSADGREITFDPKTDIIRMPGGKTKFTIRFDPKTDRYWSLVNKASNPRAVRNVLALISSRNVRDWRVESVLLMHPDTGNHAFQYVDWQFDGNNIIAASRTAWGNSHNFHDANYLTFHRVMDFRSEARSIK